MSGDRVTGCLLLRTRSFFPVTVRETERTRGEAGEEMCGATSAWHVDISQTKLCFQHCERWLVPVGALPSCLTRVINALQYLLISLWRSDLWVDEEERHNLIEIRMAVSHIVTPALSRWGIMINA